MNILKAVAATLTTNTQDRKLIGIDTIYNIRVNALNGKPINLEDFKGKYMLFVNVASKCGFTSQYEELQELHEKYKDVLQVIGVPCNQFGGQEPGSAQQIESFCQINYGVSFIITEKIEVKGKNQHPLYTWLTQEINNGVMDSSVKWNFQKYLVSPKGKLIDYYFSATSPLNTKITKHLK